MSERTEDDFAEMMKQSYEIGINNMAKEISDHISKEVISEIRELAEGGQIEIIRRKLKGEFTLPVKYEVEEEIYFEPQEEE